MRNTLPDKGLGFWTGFGTGLIFAGVLAGWRIGRLMKNEEALRRAMREEKDERNIAILQRTFSTAASIGILLLYIGMLVFYSIDYTVFRTLFFCACLFTFLIFAVRAIYERIM